MNLDSIGDWTRTHYTSQVTPEIDAQEVTLFGWVQDIRDLGGIRFIILQDREGTIQLTIPKKRILPEVLAKSDLLQKRFALGVKGTVKKTNMTPRGIEIIPSCHQDFQLSHRTVTHRHHRQNARQHRSTLRCKTTRPHTRKKLGRLQNPAYCT